MPFEPPSTVRMYVCGITPYDSTHLGHAATYLTYDLLIRRLQERGHEVRMVRNVTDVDDSILPKARELGVSFLELAESELKRFREDMLALGMLAPTSEPRATEAVPGMIDMIQRLLDTGHAYVAHETTYFAVSTFPAFGELSHYSRSTWCGSPAPAEATPTTRTVATRSTSCSGNPRCPTSRRGALRSGSGDRAGTSNAR